ncbi:MAG: KpsF/GutQ family sugar-phosphate isomerase [Pseudomonadota bacterium]
MTEESPRREQILIASGREVIEVEVEALQRMAERLDDRFAHAVETVLAAEGRLVVVGMGKSGIIGRKIVATLASTGTPSFFVHPGEAFHGDLGMIHPSDVALMISNSGETEELIRLLPFMEHQGNRVIAMTGGTASTLAAHADVVLDISVPREACNNNLAPTSSTTATLVMGDALAVALSTERGFQPEDFARFHPGGSLGRRLLTRVADVMHTRDLPICAPETGFRDLIHTMSNGRLGLALVMEGDSLLGIVTDGDLRRLLEREDNPMALTAGEAMTPSPKTISPEMRFAEAEDRMQAEKISALVVTDDAGRVRGILQIYDLEG